MCTRAVALPLESMHVELAVASSAAFASTVSGYSNEQIGCLEYESYATSIRMDGLPAVLGQFDIMRCCEDDDVDWRVRENVHSAVKLSLVHDAQLYN